MNRRWILALASVLIAAPASAQFTTFIAPPSPIKDSIKAAVVAGQRSAADSITRARITDMKTWVDSAAGMSAVRPIQPPAKDTTSATATTPPAAPPPAVATTVSNGVVAPETASPLPLLLILGGSAMLVGFMVMRWSAATRPRIDS